MIDAVAMIEVISAEKRQFEAELDRKSKWQDGRESRKSAGLISVRRVAGRVRQLASSSQVSEAPAGC